MNISFLYVKVLIICLVVINARFIVKIDNVKRRILVTKVNTFLMQRDLIEVDYRINSLDKSY